MADAAGLDRIVERLRGRIGLTGIAVTKRIEAGALIKFARATGQTDPLYLDEAAAKAGPYGALVAPPTYLSIFTNEVMSDGLFDFDLPFGIFLHTDDAVEMGAPILAGDDIHAIARYADAYWKPARDGPLLFQVAEMILTNQRGERAATVRVGSVSFDPPAARA